MKNLCFFSNLKCVPTFLLFLFSIQSLLGQSFEDNFNDELSATESFARTLAGVPFDFVFTTNGDRGTFGWSPQFGDGGSAAIVLNSNSYNVGRTERVTIKRQDGNTFNFASIFINNISGEAVTVEGYHGESAVGSPQVVGKGQSLTLNFSNITVTEVRLTSTNFSFTIFDSFKGALSTLNNTPTVILPAISGVQEDVVYDLPDDIQVLDGDGGDLTLTFNVTGGKVSLGTAGITFEGSGNGSASFTASGSLSDLNAALDAATFVSDLNYNGAGAGTITFVANDGTENSNTASRTFDIEAINDDPTMDPLPSPLSMTEDISTLEIGVLLINSLSSFRDVDLGNNPIKLILESSSGIFRLSIPGGPYTGSGTNKITLEGLYDFILIELNRNALQILYTPEENLNGVGAAEISVYVNDNGNTGTGGGTDVLLGTVSIDIDAVNDPPFLTGLPTDLIISKDVTSNIDLSSVTFGDIDAGSSIVRLNISYKESDGFLSASTGGGVTVFGGTGELRLRGAAADIDAFLNNPANIRYTPVSGLVGDNATTLTLSADDLGNTGTGDGFVEFGNVNLDLVDSPIIEIPTNSITYTEDDVPLSIAPSLNIFDVNSPTLASASISISSNFLEGEDQLGFVNNGSSMGNIIGTFNSSLGIMTLSSSGATATLSEWGEALKAVTYVNSSQAPSTDTRTVSYVANDGNADGNTASVTIDVISVNDPPFFTGLPTDISVVEGVPSNIDLSAATFGDVDSGSEIIKIFIKSIFGTLDVNGVVGINVYPESPSSVEIIGTAAAIEEFLNIPSKIKFHIETGFIGVNVPKLFLTADDLGNTGIGDGVADFGIINIEVKPLISISVDDVSVAEGNAGSTNLQFTVSLDAPAPVGGAKVDYATSDGSAIAGTDYTEANGTLEFAEGESSKTIDVSVSGDTEVEASEIFTLTLSNPNGTGVVLGDAAGTGLIFNDDFKKATRIYWANGNRIQSAKLDGSDIQNVLTGSYVGVRIDNINQKIYFNVRNGDIFKSDLDGSNRETVISGANAYGIALDLANNKIYWTDYGNNRIGSANLDGSNIENVIASTNEPTRIWVDNFGNKLYWTSNNNGKVLRSNLDGSNLEGGIISGLSFPWDVQVDALNGKIYFTDVEELRKADLDGSNIEILANRAQGMDLDPEAGKVYYGGLGIRIVNLDGSGDEEIIPHANTSTILGIALSTEDIVVIASVDVPENKTYKKGDNLDFVVHFSEEVNLNGNLSLSLDIGGVPKSANYISGSGSSSLNFSYTVAIGDLDMDGIEVTGLTLDGGTVQNSEGMDANLTLNNVSPTSGVLVDGVAPSGYSVTWDDDLINADEALNTSFTLSGAEVGSTLEYTIQSSEDNTTEIVRRVEVVSTTQVVNLDVSGLADGRLTVSVQLIDAAGNSGIIESDNTAILDKTPPSSPGVPDMVSSSDAGLYDDDNITNISKPTFEGTVEPNISVAIFINGNHRKNDLSNDLGHWEFSPANVLPDGTYQIQLRTIDEAGNRSEMSAPLAFTIDTKAPSQPLGLNLLANSDTGISDSDEITKDNRPEIYAIIGDFDGGEIILRDLNSEEILARKVNLNSAVNMKFIAEDYLSDLTDGLYQFRINTRDIAGNWSPDSEILEVRIDTEAPSGYSASFDQEFFNSQTDLNNITFTTTGAEIGVEMIYSINNGPERHEGNLTVSSETFQLGPFDISGWSDGNISLEVTMRDIAGNVGRIVSTSKLKDIVPPAAPSTPDLVPESDTGRSNSDNITADNTPTFKGTAVPNSTVILYSWSIEIGSSTVDDAGNWLFTFESPLPDGTYSVTARAIDLAGNQGELSSQLIIYIDASTPDIPIFTELTNDTGVSSTDRVTSDNTLNFVGYTFSNSASFVTLSIEGIGEFETFIGSGPWVIDLSGSPFADGVYTFYLFAENIAGNKSPTSPPMEFTVDTQAPDQPSIPDMIPESDLGPSDEDNLTNDNTPTFRGTAEPNSMVELFIVYSNSPSTIVLQDEILASETGEWTFTSPELANNNYRIYVRAKDLAGNQSIASESLSFNINVLTLTRPTITNIRQGDDSGIRDNITNILSPEILIYVTYLPTTTFYLEVFGSDNSSIGSRYVVNHLERNNYGVKTNLEKDGVYQVYARITDIFGNEGTPSDLFMITIDTQAPAIPEMPDMLESSDKGISNSDNITNETKPSFQGNTEAFAKIELMLDGNLVPETTEADLNGDWVLGLTNPLIDGEHEIRVRASDVATNTSEWSDPLSIWIDTQAPEAPAAPDLAPESDSGISDTDNLTNDRAPTIQGTAEPNSTIVLFNSEQGEVEVPVDASGNWTFTYTTDFPSASTFFRAKAIDLAGNESANSGQLNVDIDFIAPVAVVDDPIIQLDANGQASLIPSDIILSLLDNYSLKANISLELTQNSFDCSDVGAGSIYLKATDEAGNTSSWLSSIIVRDEVPPTIKTKSSITLNVEPVGTVELTASMVDEGSVDNCGILSRTFSQSSFSASDAGSNSVRYFVKDVNGNESSVDIEVNVVVVDYVLTVSANENQMKEYGDPDPVLTYSVQGLQNGDDINILTGDLNRLPGKDVGTYPIGQGNLTVNKAGYGINFVSADFEITPATLTITPDAGQSKVFGEADPVFDYQVSGFKLSETSSLMNGNLSREAGEDVGTYAYQLGDLDAGINYSFSLSPEVFEITATIISGITFENGSFVFDGTEKSLAITGTLPTGTSVVYSNNGRTDVGTQEVTATISGSNYNTLELKADLTVTKAEITGITFGDGSFVYDGTEKSLMISGTLPVGTLVVYSNNGRTDVGTQEVTATISGSNYNTLELKADLTVTKAEITGITFGDGSFVFDGTEKSLAITGSLPAGTSVAYTNNGRTELGSQEVTATITGSNYNTLELKADLTIVKGDITGVSLANRSFMYDGTEKSLAITGTLPVGTAVVYSNNGRTDVGTQEVTATISGSNYNTLELKADLTITPAEFGAISFTDGSFVYDGTEKSLAITGSLPVGTSVVYSNNGRTDVGTQEVTATISGSNFNTLELKADLTVTKAEITGISFSDGSFVNDGTEKSLAITGTLPAGTAVVYSNNGRTDVGTQEVAATISGSNYNTLELKADLTVTKAEITGITFGDGSFVFDGTEKSLAITGTLPAGTAVVYSNNDRTDVGTQEVTATISGSNFNTLELKADLTITPAEFGAISFTDGSFVFDGTEKSLAITGTLPAGTSVAYTNNGRTDVGTQEVTATITGSNFNTLELKADLTITPATITGIVFADASFVYDGTAKSLAITGTLPTGTTVSYANNSRTDVGTQEVTATITGSNFNTLELKADLTITPAEFGVISFTDGSFVYDGTEKSLAITGTLPVGASVAYTNNGRTDVGTQEVTATISGSNFNTLELKADLNVTKAEITGITFGDGSFVFDGTEKSLAITGTLPAGTAVVYSNNGRTEVGTQEVTATISGLNYNTLELKADLTITPAEFGAISFTDGSFVYDGTEKSLTITGNLPVGASVAYTNNGRTDVGTQEVTATISGSNFNTLELKADLNVTKAEITGITFGDGSFVFDGTEKNLMISGTLPVGTSVVYSNNGRTDVGTQEVTATISGSNYNTLELKADLTVTKADLTVIADSGLSKFAGESDPEFTYTVSGLAEGESMEVFAGSLSRAAGDDPGMYAITQGSLTAGDNYTITFIGADFEIIDGDTDGDGVSDQQEEKDGTDPSDPTDFKDTDGDGVPDYVEEGQGTDPADSKDYKDQDGDQVPDYVEEQQGTDPMDPENVQDTDGDGVSDYDEEKDGTDPKDPTDFKDTDGDGVPDYVEEGQGTDPTDPEDYKDQDGDQVPDYVEEQQGTDPMDPEKVQDSDGDGVSDYDEEKDGTDPTDPTDFKDTDGDGVPDYMEEGQGTDPADSEDYKDQDGDQVPDYVEVQQGTDPNNPDDAQDTDGDGVPDYIQERSITELVVQSIQVAWNTPEASLILPTEAMAITGLGEMVNVPVTWDLTGYDPLMSGTTVYEGTISSIPGIFNTYGLTAELNIEVLAKPAPTDVTLSENEFIGIPDQYFQEIGFFTVIDATDDQHSLSLPEGMGDNELFEVIDGILFWSSQDQRAGETQFEVVLQVEDRGGNVIQKSFLITRGRTPLSDLDVVNTFTPNADGVNDTWGVPALRYYRGSRIQVFDRGGKRLFYTENPDVKWDGTFEGEEMGVDAYFWVIEVEETGEVRRGILNLLRQ